MTDAVERRPGFREALRFWVRLGFISFGGPAGQIAILHRPEDKLRGQGASSHWV